MKMTLFLDTCMNECINKQITHLIARQYDAQCFNLTSLAVINTVNTQKQKGSYFHALYILKSISKEKNNFQSYKEGKGKSRLKWRQHQNINLYPTTVLKIQTTEQSLIEGLLLKLPHKDCNKKGPPGLLASLSLATSPHPSSSLLHRTISVSRIPGGLQTLNHCLGYTLVEPLPFFT